MSEGKSCIMFVSHKLTAFTLCQLDSLRRSVDPARYDVVLLMNADSSSAREDGVYCFNRSVAEAHGFTMHSYYLDTRYDFYGNNFEYSFMSFYLDHPEYKFYWLIEWDVYCNGSWSVALEHYDGSCDADYMGTHIQFGTDGGWQNTWKPFVDYQWIKSFNVKPCCKVKCFNPVARFSSRALDCLCSCYRAGDYGFYEIAMPTLLFNNGMKLQNFDGLINDSSIRFRPGFKTDFNMIRDGVYHPVKQKPLHLLWLRFIRKTR